MSFYVKGDNLTLGGTGKEQEKRHPAIKDHVMLSAGVKVLGSFTVGEHVKIGTGAVVLEKLLEFQIENHMDVADRA